MNHLKHPSSESASAPSQKTPAYYWGKSSLWLSLLVCITLTACTASNAYVAGLPKHNTVMPESTSHIAYFDQGKTRLSRDERARLADFLYHLPADAVQDIVLESDYTSKAANDRAGHLSRLLRIGGYANASIAAFETGTMSPLTQPAHEQGGHQIRVQVHYMKVMPPQGCPDWRHGEGWGNPDNLPSSNFGCAALTNLGQMVSDPTDLLGRESIRMGGSDNAALTTGRYTSSFAQQGIASENE